MSDDLIVTVQDTSLTNVTSDLSNPIYLESLSNVGDIDIATNGRVNGSVLVYKPSTNKWTSTTILDAQDVTGGQY